MAQDGGESFLAQLSLPEITDSGLFGQVNDRAVAYARDRSAELVTGLDDSTRDMLASDIADSLEANEGLDGLIDRLQDAYAFSEDRATLIARTEVTAANQQGALEGMRLAQKAGVTLKKSWLPDAEACEDCQQNGDDGAIGLDEQFSSGDDAPPAHPRCECSLISEVEEDNGEDEEE